ncbi:MAG: Uma2 family endonuclease [Aphanocapsa sp. GSE-SYN-MK-11-07L]|jgi:Uma2 family endonuclease|nr:Uma2 family endonuclease [Aphanocapsa sp. GSE-SYN-MK-11-07L]
MTISTRPNLTFEAYLTYDDGTDNRYQWVDGALIEMPPESAENDEIARALGYQYLVKLAGFFQVRTHNCEIEVPVLRPGLPRNRYPDLVILRLEHRQLTRQRLTIRLEMPEPILVVEVVSPGQANIERDYQDKRAQYQARGIPEYWLIHPEQQIVMVLTLVDDVYQEKSFQGKEQIISRAFPTLNLTVEQVLNPQE